jgi:hypothetical protein
MRKVDLVCLLAVLVSASQASAGYLWFESFENGQNGWVQWVDRANSDAGGLVAEPPTLGAISPESGANATVLRVGGAGYNGGYYKVISGLPTNTPLRVDGFWRHSSTSQTNNDWEEVQVLEGAISYTPGDDINYPSNLEYKNDNFSGHPNFPVGGQISTLAPVANDGNFQTASGTVTVVLKYGNNTGSTQMWCEFDDVYITPEPASLALLGLPMLLIRRRM